jgi:DNA-binding MarR family transcriptional regulator
MTSAGGSSALPGGSSVNTAHLLHEAVDAIERVVPRRLALRGHGAVRTAHGAVFQHLDEEGTTVSLLAERAGMTKQAMAELVGYLETHGYVERSADPHDRRAKLVQLTSTGREVASFVLSLLPEMEERIVSAIGRSRWGELRSDLATIHDLFAADPTTEPEDRTRPR